jgi:uncharacterized membrane protein YphA (DoxX/SURF4 family)
MIIGVGIVAILVTLATYFLKGEIKNWLISLLQNFTGVLFIWSGLVKAVDPLGTAYKMQDYFAEFYSTFSETSFSFIAPMFPWFSEHAIATSVIMIVFEIALGVMLIIGAMRKITAWAFLLLVVFFLVLTGYTYLTGYVADGVNFFQFMQWGPWVETNMKVTDCGCFGDFIKLKPFTSFLKDVALMFPAILFVFTTDKMHQIFSKGTRAIISIATIVGFTFYCISNYMWDVPDVDFRPFKENVNIAEQKAAEIKALEGVRVTHYEVTNLETGEFKRLPFDQYMSEFKNYPKTEWDLKQIKSIPAMEETKISYFELEDENGSESHDGILAEEGYSFLVVAYKLYGNEGSQTVTIIDTTYVTDTISIMLDSLTVDPISPVQIVTSIDTIVKRQVVQPVFTWDENYIKHWKGTVNPVMKAAAESGLKVNVATAYLGIDGINSFKEASGSDFMFHQGDDIMLKTIIRSNPGVLLLKNGTIVKKWHYKKLPHFESIQEDYLK